MNGYKIRGRSANDYMEIGPFKTKQEANKYIVLNGYYKTEIKQCKYCLNIKTIKKPRLELVSKI